MCKARPHRIRGLTAVVSAVVPSSNYYPSGQTLYTWSSGTSHSTPAIAGTASLVWNYYGRVLKPGATPSPAMLKALLLNSTRYLQGLSTGDTLPSNNQGWGDANLGTLFDGTPRVIVDQSQVFTATGQQQTLLRLDPGSEQAVPRDSGVDGCAGQHDGQFLRQ